MLTSSIAIVIGPTPPGTGVIAARDLGDRLEVDVAHEPVLGAVRADVDHGRARLDHVGRRPGAARRPRRPGCRRGGRRRPGRGSASGRWSRSRSPRAAGSRADADEVRAPDDDRLRPLQLDALVAQQLHHARPACRARAPGAPGRAGRRCGRQPVDVLGGVDRGDDASGSIGSGSGELDEDAVDVVVGPERARPGRAAPPRRSSARGRGGSTASGLLAGLALVARRRSARRGRRRRGRSPAPGVRPSPARTRRLLRRPGRGPRRRPPCRR